MSRNEEYDLYHHSNQLPSDTNKPTTTKTTTMNVSDTDNSKDEKRRKLLQTIAGVIGNILEWYDFALFGIFSDIIGDVFFPPQEGDAAVIESFAVFGSAFIFRPLGGILIGYIGDKYGRKKALETSIFFMAIPTFLMGLLPSYARIGYASTVLLILVRILQGVSVGGQLTSSLLFTVSSYPKSQWGFYGAVVFATSTVGGVLGTLVGFVLRQFMAEESLRSWGWRVPFVAGIVMASSAVYLKLYGDEVHVKTTESENGRRVINPIKEAFAPENRHTLLSCILVPMLYAAGGYVTSVWLPIYMNTIMDPPVPYAFGISSLANFVGTIIALPLMGMLSDNYGRIRCMTIAACALAVLGPMMITIISERGSDSPFTACAAQTVLFLFISMWLAPMTAWLAVSFPEHIRLTAVSIGYNICLATVGGFSPAIATMMVDRFGRTSPGYIFTVLAVFTLIGLHTAPTSVDVCENETDEDGDTKYASFDSSTTSISDSDIEDYSASSIPLNEGFVNVPSYT
eukprot:CAMPEP_0172498602 /NCGR_PEP_ID=MMETSP1066-20121228/114211_1 /TAXON_ID=671091 /ORGANISM="Coscinodiscus wailesii, Strain CCMP2513" /LENGTH=512 /DNA_ID=CAMNT_0013271929 /DNA_START=24 /DNA_END=1562 /DNA_ORIENTATION=+